MKRGDVVTVALPGSMGKPQPAVVVQADLVPPGFRTVSLVPLTSDLEPVPVFRVTVEPSPSNGLRKLSQVMVDNLPTLATSSDR